MCVDYEALDKKDKENLAKTISTKPRQHGSPVTTKNKELDDGAAENGSEKKKKKKTSSQKKKQSSKQINQYQGTLDNNGGSDSIRKEEKSSELNLLKDILKSDSIVATGDGNTEDEDDKTTPKDNTDSNQPRFSIQ